MEKIGSFPKQFCSIQNTTWLLWAKPEDLDLLVVLYMATDRAIDHIENETHPRFAMPHGVRAFVKSGLSFGKPRQDHARR